MKRLSVIVLLFCFILVGCSREDEIKREDKEEEKSIYTINKVLMGDKLVDYKDEFKIIIDAVKEKYSNFKEEDYLVFYLNEERIEDSNFRIISFVYAIDGYIRTNSSITVVYENNKIDSIETSGVDVKYVDIDKLNDKIKQFELKKKDIIKDKLPNLYKKDVIINGDYTLSKDGLSDNIGELNEYYFYDFSNNKLLYKIEIGYLGAYDTISYMVDKDIEIE